MENKIRIDKDKFANDGEIKAYLFNCLNNERQIMIKAIVFA